MSAIRWPFVLDENNIKILSAHLLVFKYHPLPYYLVTRLNIPNKLRIDKRLDKNKNNTIY